MGLDQYLFRANREKLNKYHNLSKEEREELESPCVEVCYWRKANQIRQYFVEHCDYPEDGNCIDFEVDKSDLLNLVKTCKEVLDNHDLAQELLPVSSGFFFGSNEYDEWYFKDLENTIDMVEKVIGSTDFDKDIVFYSEWW